MRGGRRVAVDTAGGKRYRVIINNAKAVSDAIAANRAMVRSGA